MIRRGPMLHRDNLGLCPACGKQSFATRKKARRAAKDQHPGDSMTAYICRDRPEAGEWHYGHSQQWRFASPLAPVSPAPPQARAAMAQMAGRRA